jgi:hypothetical protein
MKSGTSYALSVLICASVLSLPTHRAGAQDTVLKAEPLIIQEEKPDVPKGLEHHAGEGLNARVKVNINNENIREAVKKVIGKSDVTYEIDADVPSDVKVSLKADNILLSTAINVIIESAGIGCTQSTKRTVTDTDKVKLTLARTHLHFTKAATPPLRDSSSYWFQSMAPKLFENGNWPNKDFNLPNVLFKGADGKSPLDGLFENPKMKMDFTNKLSDGLKIYSSPKNGVQPFLYNLTTSEERSTFTCPHCKQQVTIIKKHVTPKCPTCGRTFQDDWKFCPVDGTKRPEDSSDWKFCPHCGKAVSELTVNAVVTLC